MTDRIPQDPSDNHLRSVAMIVWASMKTGDSDRAVKELRKLLGRKRGAQPGNTHMLGHPHTEATKKAISKGKMGVPKSPEAKAKMSASQRRRWQK